MSAAPPAAVTIHADQEHSGLRLVIFVALFVGFFLGFQLMVWLLSTLAPAAVQDYTTFLACVGAIPLALLMIWALERWLKRVWHSGLSLVLDWQGITVNDRRQPPAGDEPGDAQRPTTQVSEGVKGPAITWAGNMSQLNWYFRLSGYPRGGRERRVSNKWLCLATELNQDGAKLNVYAFLSPERAAALIDDPRLAFRRLNPAEVYDSSMRSRFTPPTRPAIPNNLLHSKDGRHWLAERRRWEYGIELAPQDFITLVTYVQTHRRPDLAAEEPPLHPN